MRSQVWSTYIAATAMLSATSVAAVGATPEQAKAFSERASSYIEQVGEEKAFADFTRKDGRFVDGELYVFCYDHKGVNMAHGGNPSFDPYLWSMAPEEQTPPSDALLQDIMVFHLPDLVQARRRWLERRSPLIRIAAYIRLRMGLIAISLPHQGELAGFRPLPSLHNHCSSSYFPSKA